MAGETVTTQLVTKPLLTSKSVGEVVAQTWSIEVPTAQMQTNDITAIAKLPKGATLHYAIIKTDDLDTDGSVALVWSILIGSAAWKAGLANDTLKAGTLVTPDADQSEITAESIVYIKSTTAAATAAEGTFTITLFYTTSE